MARYTVREVIEATIEADSPEQAIRAYWAMSADERAAFIATDTAEVVIRTSES